MIKKRPYLVVPKLIEQPTWGGTYLLDMKRWSDNNDFKGRKIGQSYELFSGTKLLLNISSSEDPAFVGELGSPDTPEVFNKTGYEKNKDYILVSEATKLKDKISLIKLTQSNGNSFQLHIKKGLNDKRWRPKPETWYYFEDGLVTFGIKKGVNVEDYKKACKAIENEMKKLSGEVVSGGLSLDDARKQAKSAIKEIDPWQFVNYHVVKKGSIVDPSKGGIHHSWEEDLENFPLGNVLYEIQKDVMDPVCTIRSFDKGKLKSDGSIREINVDDYFKYLDTDPDHNDIKKMTPLKKGDTLIKNYEYALDLLEIDRKTEVKTEASFAHIFVRDGEVEVEAEEGKIHLSSGHSCFIPENTLTYSVKPIGGRATILKAYTEV